LEAKELFFWAKEKILKSDYSKVLEFLKTLEDTFTSDLERQRAIDVLIQMIDLRYPTGRMRRSSLLSLFDKTFKNLMKLIENSPSQGFAFLKKGGEKPFPKSENQVLVIDSEGFSPEGENSLALTIVEMYIRGFKNIFVINAKGQRFIGCGLGPNTKGLRIDVFGSSGDYLASGIDGAEIYVHNNAQDQVAQIMKEGKLVIYGDVGQTFMYGAKGGKVFVQGNAAGRPLINAVGKPRVVINGTCLDYLAESFMAGDPLNGGGFVVLNGVTFDEDGQLKDLETPYPGGNLFSLASGGAIYIRDPHHKVEEDQLNGGEFVLMTQKDWELIKDYLEENEKIFGIPVEKLLEVEGRQAQPEYVYRKIKPNVLRPLQAEEAWVKKE